MEKIRKFLLENGYELWDEDTIDGCNEYLRIMVIKKDDGFIIRNAILWCFDRWANSGVEVFVNSEDEVIKYFSTPEKCIKDAVSELVETICEEAGWNNDYSKVSKMIDSLYDLVEEDCSD